MVSTVRDVAPGMFVCPLDEDAELGGKETALQTSRRSSPLCDGDWRCEFPEEGIELEDWWSLTADRLVRVFQTLDSDSDGRVPFGAARESLARYGMHGANFPGLCERLDEDASHDLTVEEFVSAVRETMLEKLFSHEAKPGCAMMVEYSDAECHGTWFDSAADVREKISMRNSKGNRWIDATGETVLKTLAVRYGFHPLALEDALSPHQRPKVERYPNHVLFVIPRFRIMEEGRTSRQTYDGKPDIAQLPQFSVHNICIFLANSFDTVVTFAIDDENGLQAAWSRRVRAKLDKSYTKLREADAQQLTYEILDALVDSLFPVARTYRAALYSERAAIRASKYRRDLVALSIIKSDIDRLARISRPLYRVVSHVTTRGTRVIRFSCICDFALRMHVYVDCRRRPDSIRCCRVPPGHQGQRCRLRRRPPHAPRRSPGRRT